MQAIRTLAALFTAALLAVGCSGAGEDVRVRLCKDIVTVQGGTAPLFQSAEARTRGREYAEVRVAYTAGGEAGSASCFYRYNAVEDTADQIANPLTAYSTSPYRVIIGSRTLPQGELATAIGRAMQKQGREFVEQAGEAARKALSQ
ncbi:hypothetical protein [Thiohalocapsa sp. ML1]|jgi:hypothetical protein|uniref:hypothetical protein n=1 Tax=Thiohalocapsa sp. ML1 TaxID=1431688 RepID=UPI00073202E6|nr:hypothetical protein [Thiohalocapsa sp. ML1]